MVEDEECCEVGENLVTGSGENLSVLVASKWFLLTERIVASDDIIYVKKKKLQNERYTNQPRYRQYGPCQFQAQVRSASHVGNLDSDVNLKHGTS